MAEGDGGRNELTERMRGRYQRIEDRFFSAAGVRLGQPNVYEVMAALADEVRGYDRERAGEGRRDYPLDVSGLAAIRQRVARTAGNTDILLLGDFAWDVLPALCDEVERLRQQVDELHLERAHG